MEKVNKDWYCGKCNLRHRTGLVIVCDIWESVMSFDTTVNDWFKCGKCEDNSKVIK